MPIYYLAALAALATFQRGVWSLTLKQALVQFVDDIDLI